jgi:hypothetical protein
MFRLSRFDSGYCKPLRKSEFHGIPVKNLEDTKLLLANLYPGQKYRIRYRGPRVGLDNRTKTQQYQDCVKAHATTFAVYFL